MAKSFNILHEPGLTYYTIADQDLFQLIQAIRDGIRFPVFEELLAQLPFTFNEWSGFLLLSDRTMQRYRKERKSFDQGSSEKILEVLLLYRYGVQVFVDRDKFNAWLTTINLALGSKMPMEFLDTSFGINLLKDELFRIEQGLLA